MRFVHTADWHLGKTLLGHSLLADQAHALGEVLRICRESGAEALVIAGDVFDRPVPPADAVTLFSDFLSRVTRELRIPVLAISGNHDSGERLGFARELLGTAGIHLGTAFGDRLAPVVLKDRGGFVTEFVLLPYLDPEEVRLGLGERDAADNSEPIRGHDAAVRASLATLPVRGEGHGRVLVGHLFCVGGQESPESERPLAVGTLGHVSPSSLWGFDYVALGHLHRPQAVGGREAMRYSGSLLKYSVDEHTQPKAVTVVDVDAAGVRTEQVSFAPARDLVRLEGTMDALLTDAAFEKHGADYVSVIFTDENFVMDPVTKLRARFPFLLEAIPARALRAESTASRVARRPEAPRELLAAFWQHVGEPHALEEAHLALFEETLAKARRGDGEA